jgi:GT2 family glycosyltransferase
MAWEAVVVECGNQVRGYTAPQNQAVRAARAPYVALMNDDVEVTPGWIQPLLQALDGGAPCASPDMTHTDGPQVYAPYCVIWRHDVWDELGGMDEQFVHWCSDIDIARRLTDTGRLPVRVRLPQAIVHHLDKPRIPEVEATIGQIVVQDLDRYRHKWGISAEQDKVRLRDLVWSPDDE